MQEVLDRTYASFEKLLVDVAFPGEGGRVLDIGCGAGATTIAMARRLGSRGLSLGVDISAPLVAAAKVRAARERIAAAQFLEADAQTFTFEPQTFDAIISRFGVMFFEDSVAAFANFRHAARQRATLACVVWRSPADNEFISSLPRAVAGLLAIPPVDPDAPGQFAFADPGRVQSILQESGWSNAEIEPLDVLTTATEGDLLAYVTKLGPIGLALKKEDESMRARVAAALHGAVSPHIQNGVVRFTSACWLVRARA
jgi:SAM-dependent methyltransferase